MLVRKAQDRRVFHGRVFQFHVPFEIVRPGQRDHADLALELFGEMRFHVLFHVGHALAAHRALRALRVL